LIYCSFSYCRWLYGTTHIKKMCLQQACSN
jgi:hypothetical protein